MVIYKITNQINGKVYIGQSHKAGDLRWKAHVRYLNGEYHSNPYLQKAWKKYGSTAFQYEIVEEVGAIEELDSTEQKWIAHFNSNRKKFGYNLTAGGGGIRGYHHTENAKRKMSASRMGHPVSFETKQKIGQANSTKKKSQELRQRISQTNRQLFADPKMRRKNSLAHNPSIANVELISPTGELHKIEVSLAVFAEKYKLSLGNLCAVINGYRRTVNGWRLAGSDFPKTRKISLIGRRFVSPTGEVYEVKTTATMFCKLHGLDPSSVSSMLRGQLNTHKGWTLEKLDGQESNGKRDWE